MNLFDGLQDSMMDIVSNTMGYDGFWVNENIYGQADFDSIDFNSADFKTNVKAAAFGNKVLYNGPTEREKIFSADYDPDKVMMEYKADIFPGLFEQVRKKTTVEEVIIEGVGIFYIKSVKKKWDGKTYEAQLELKP